MQKQKPAWKSLMAAILILALCLSCCPGFSAGAEEPTPVDVSDASQLSTALNTDGNYVRLTADITVNGMVTIGTGDNAPTQDMDIHIYSDSPRAITGECAADYSANFTSDNPDLTVANVGNALYLAGDEYGITYLDADGNPITVSAGAPTSCFEGVGVSLAGVVPAVIPEGMAFSGWYDAAEGGNAVTAVGADEAADITLYARFVEAKYAEPLTLTMTSGSIELMFHVDGYGYTPDLQYSLNDGDWITMNLAEYEFGTQNTGIAPYGSPQPQKTLPLTEGDVLRLRGENGDNGFQTRFYATGDGEYTLSGNIMSLLSRENFAEMDAIPDTHAETNYGVFSEIFSRMYGLTSAENLLLPAKTLWNRSYMSMFGEDRKLEKGPQIQATTLAGDYCLRSVFYECSSLKEAPALPATTLCFSCYSVMFNGCTSLKEAPVLPATTLVSECYNGMFYGCSNLSSITACFTNWSSGCTDNWVGGVAGTGSFVCPAELPKTFGVNNIPEGWHTDNQVLLQSGLEGRIVAEPSAAFAGETITLTLAPDTVLEGEVYVRDAGGNPVELTQDGNIWRFEMPDCNVTVSADITTSYTVLYRTGSGVQGVQCKVNGLEDYGEMEENCVSAVGTAWSMQFDAMMADSLTLSFREDDGSWSAPTAVSVGGDWTNAAGGAQCRAVHGSVSLVALAFVEDNSKSLMADGGTRVPEDAEDEGTILIVAEKNASVTIPTPAARDGLAFQYWEDGSGNRYNPGESITAAMPEGASGNVLIIQAVWRNAQSGVSFDLNGGSGSADAQVVNWGSTAAKPADPTRRGYVFVKWVVAEDVTENGTPLVKGQAFDFAQQITADLKLKAEWKHVHSYKCRQLDDAEFDGAFSAYCTSAYLSAIHVRICDSWDDYAVEAHSFDGSGRCACGYQKPVQYVTVHQIGKADVRVEKNTPFTLTAPERSGSQVFNCWGYSTNGSSYSVLSYGRSVTFTVPCDLWVYPFYKEEPKPQTRLTAQRYEGGLLFRMDYALPSGWTAKDCVVKVGDNNQICFYEAVTEKYKSGSSYRLSTVKTKTHTVYYSRGDCVLREMSKAQLFNYMYSGQGVTKDSMRLYSQKASNLGSNSLVYLYMNPSATSQNGLEYHIYYAIGYLTCVDPQGQTHILKEGAIASCYAVPDLSDYYEN